MTEIGTGAGQDGKWDKGRTGRVKCEKLEYEYVGHLAVFDSGACADPSKCHSVYFISRVFGVGSWSAGII
eukprot:1391988-Amorphochlora_amoeboformis.AAC.1